MARHPAVVDPVPEMPSGQHQGLSQVARDVDRFPIVWTNGDATIRLHRQLETLEGLVEPWNDWEHPRRVEFLRRRREALGDWKARLS